MNLHFFNLSILFLWSVGEQTFRIEISDKNDNPPYFTKEVFVADAISEDANVNALVTEIEAKDQDTGEINLSIFYYISYNMFIIECMSIYSIYYWIFHNWW